VSDRLLWITEHYPPGRGGMATSCARQVREMRQSGRLVDVVVLGASALETAPRDNGCDFLIPPDQEDGLAVNLAFAQLRPPYAGVVGFGASGAGYYAVTFAAWLGCPSVVLVRGNDLDRDWFQPGKSAWVQEAFARAGAIGAVTPQKVERIRRLYPGKPVEWTPNSVDVARWAALPADLRRRDEMRRLLRADGAKVIGLFGELKAKKRIPWWLEAVRDRGLLEQMRLLIVGTVDLPTAMILEDPAIAPRSVRLPFAAAEELPGLYRACDFVAIPSLFEGMPNVLLEAMACGVVPIMSDAAIPIGDAGFVFSAEDREAAGEVTARALAHPNLAEASAAAQRFVQETFSAEREREALLQLIRLAAG
jgi:glycogen(starch) synthase